MCLKVLLLSAQAACAQVVAVAVWWVRVRACVRAHVRRCVRVTKTPDASPPRGQSSNYTHGGGTMKGARLLAAIEHFITVIIYTF